MDKHFQYMLLQKIRAYWYQPLAIPLLLILTLLLGYLAWFLNWSIDLTHNQRNTLSPISLQILQQMPEDIRIQAYCDNSPYKGRYFRKSINALLRRYQRNHPNLTIEFISPTSANARAMQIKKEGELIVSYQNQQARMYLPYTEEAFSNLLLSLKYAQTAPLVFIEDAHERLLKDNDPNGTSQLKQALQAEGIPLQQIDISSGMTPSSSQTLVLANTSVPYSPAFVERLHQHLARGGNLVWLVDQPRTMGLQSLAEKLGISISEGIAIDPANREFDIPPHELASQHYATQGPTQDFSLRTFFSQVHSVTATMASQPYWKITPLIAVAEQGWVSRQYRAGQSTVPSFNPMTDQAGPITVALGMQHIKENGISQRIVIIGSSHYLQNIQLSRGGNLAMAVKLLQWVRSNQPVITVNPIPLRDAIVVLPTQSWQKRSLILLFNSYQFALPLLLSGLGVWLGYKRKSH